MASLVSPSLRLNIVDSWAMVGYDGLWWLNKNKNVIFIYNNIIISKAERRARRGELGELTAKTCRLHMAGCQQQSCQKRRPVIMRTLAVPYQLSV